MLMLSRQVNSSSTSDWHLGKIRAMPSGKIESEVMLESPGLRAWTKGIGLAVLNLSGQTAVDRGDAEFRESQSQ